jgi:hypothetical protein
METYAEIFQTALKTYEYNVEIVDSFVEKAY